MKAIQVSDTTPTVKGSYSFQGSGIAICSPCCGNTVYEEVPISERNPLTAGPFFCPACGREYCVTHGEIAEFARPSEAPKGPHSPAQIETDVEPAEEEKA